MQKKLDLEGLTFRDRALAFLQAISPSRAHLPHLVERRVNEQAVLDPSGLAAIIREITDRPGLGQHRNGFVVTEAGFRITAFTWHCVLPSKKLRLPGVSLPTRIDLLYVPTSKQWQLFVIGRDEETVRQRLNAARRLPAFSVAHRIVIKRYES